ncbi:hypothetical protein ACIG3E_33580 [Streptomyces sp. NPDC053474]|uniref:hypothetical protein n=1 Tax=Streptomyces sp. NPDC053474 TaxID=3365704 RepID=UPI0037D5701F
MQDASRSGTAAPGQCRPGADAHGADAELRGPDKANNRAPASTNATQTKELLPGIESVRQDRGGRARATDTPDCRGFRQPRGRTPSAAATPDHTATITGSTTADVAVQDAQIPRHPQPDLRPLAQQTLVSARA